MSSPYQQPRFPVKPKMGMERRLGLGSAIAVIGLSVVVVGLAIPVLFVSFRFSRIALAVLLILTALVTLAGGLMTLTRSWRTGDRVIQAGVVAGIITTWSAAGNGPGVGVYDDWGIFFIPQGLMLVIAVLGLLPVSARLVGRAPWQAVVDSWAGPSPIR